MWTQEQRNKFASTYITACKFFDKDIPIEMAKMAVDALQDLDFEMCIQALMKHMSETGKFWPKISDIRSIVSPKLDNTDQGKLIASKIYEAIGKFGHSNYLQAMEYVGETGKRAVNKFGGWTLICEQVGPIIQPTTFIAQIRDLVTVLLKEQATIGNQALLEYNETNKIEISSGLTSAVDLLNKLSIKKGE